MREILCRGKTLDEAIWKYGYYVNQYGSNMIYLPDGTDNDGFDIYHVFPETVGEYTGFKDINNERIFEGDILLEYKTTEINGKKCYKPVRKFAVELPDDYVTIIEGKDMGYDYEVIGDIYTNPDFLGGADNV